MRKVQLFLFMVFFAIYSPMFSHAISNNQFQIVGKIDGLKAGDTLRFSQVVLPQWNTETGFDIVLMHDNEFEYVGTQEHSQLYLMEFFPSDHNVPASDCRGKVLLITEESTINIQGERNSIYYSKLSGGIYDEKLQSILAEDDSLGMVRGALAVQIIQAFEMKNDSIAQVLIGHFNGFSFEHQESYKKISERKANYILNTGGEYAASELAQSTSEPLDTLTRRYEQLSDFGKQSYYGRFCSDIISKMKLVEPGQMAPKLDITTMDGSKINISDFYGKYLLIYKFGLCPGSINLDPLITNLYLKHKDRLSVLGVTDSMPAIVSSAAKESALLGMTKHPWKHEADLKLNENLLFEETFNMNGLPFCILISPKGTILVCSIGDKAYLEAVKLLE